MGVDDQFVRIARRYAQGAFGLAWLDLHRSGFAEHSEAARTDQLRTAVKLSGQLSPGVTDPELAAHWAAFEQLDEGTLGRSVWEMYRGGGFAIPGSEGGASAYLAQHDFVHVLTDYGTNLSGEIEVFALIGAADPDPKGFAWLTTLIGLFETGYVADAGFFTSDLKQRRLDSTAMHLRLADALRRGTMLCGALGTDLLEVDYHVHVAQPLDEVRVELGIPPKSAPAIEHGSVGDSTSRACRSSNGSTRSHSASAPGDNQDRRRRTCEIHPEHQRQVGPAGTPCRTARGLGPGAGEYRCHGLHWHPALADRDHPGHYLILAEFAEVDETRTPAEEAEANNQREETERWAQRLRELVDGEPEWVHYDEWYRTGITGNIRTG